MKKIIFLFGLLFVFAVTTCSAEDSPLVQAAKKEKERRAKIEPTKVLTNQDIEEVRKKTTLGIESTSTEESTTEAKQGETKTAEKEKDLATDESYWTGRRETAEAKVSAAEAKVRQLQDDISTMNKAFYIDGSADGVSQQPLLSDELNKRQELIDEANKELSDAKGELDGLEDEARQAGAPSGWVSQ